VYATLQRALRAYSKEFLADPKIIPYDEDLQTSAFFADSQFQAQSYEVQATHGLTAELLSNSGSRLGLLSDS
jgi:hypothetical protein